MKYFSIMVRNSIVQKGQIESAPTATANKMILISIFQLTVKAPEALYLPIEFQHGKNIFLKFSWNIEIHNELKEEKTSQVLSSLVSLASST